MVQVNARLSPGLGGANNSSVYGDSDGTGTHGEAGVAKHIAVSEALERWAFYATVQSERAEEFAFDIDPTSNGISAFPGIGGKGARRNSVLEAVERFSIISWWEGRGRWRLFDTDWPGVSAVAIDGPFGGVTVIAYSRTSYGMYAYGHAADESFGAACGKAVIELARHERVLYAWWLGFLSGDQRAPSDVFDRRCIFFGSEEGHELFLRRIQDSRQTDTTDAVVVCDRAVTGPWANYATVWRFALRPPSSEYLFGSDDYFFW